MFKYPTYAVALVLSSVLVGTAGAAQMVFPGADWEEATPESQLLDPAKLEAAVSYLEANSPPDGVEELVIIRNGRMIWKGPNIDNMHNVYSATKSFTSTVLGLLIDDGRATLDTLGKDYVTSLVPDYPAVTLRHFATMTSGYHAVGDYSFGLSPTPFDPDTRLFAPGSQFAYWESAMKQFGNVLTQIAGEPMEDLFKRRIADPIGMDPAKWYWPDFGEVGGIVVNRASSDFLISAREAARLGHLFLNRGNWDGQQLITASWVDDATKVQVPESIPVHPESGTAGGPGVYGYNWWVNGVLPNGSRLFPGATTGTYCAWGARNNLVFAIPEWEMVIVRGGVSAGGNLTGTTLGSFLSQVNSARITTATLIWDGLGDGSWEDMYPVSKNSRWLSETGHPMTLYPYDELRAIVRSDTVAVTADHAACGLTVESGGVVIAATAALTVGEHVDVGAGATLHVAGTLNAQSLTTAGTTTFTEGSLGVLDTVNVTDGTTTLSSPNIGTINATGGILNTAADVIELNVDGGTVNTSADVTAEDVNLTTGAIHLGDNTHLYVATMEISDGTVNTGTGHVVVSDRLKIGDRTTMKIRDGTFNVNSLDLADAAVADNLTLSGGRLSIGGGTVAPPGAIAIWKFGNEGGPNTTIDSSTAGNDHLATLKGPEPDSDHPDHPTALRFNGDAYVEVANTGDIQFGNPFTIGMWIKTSQKGGELIGKDNGDGKWKFFDKALYVEAGSGQVKFDSPWSGTLVGNTNVADGEWHHLSVTFNGSTAPGDQEIYVDGENRTDPGGRGYSGGLDMGDVFRLGSAESDYEEYIGLMDDVYLYDRSLSAAEVADLYQAFSSVLEPLPNTNLRVTADSTLYLDTASHEAVLGNLRLDPGVALRVTGAALLLKDVTAGDGSSIEGDVGVSGTLSPGNSVGTLSVTGELTMQAGSTYRWELGSSANDLVKVDLGTLLLETGWKLQLHALGGRAVEADDQLCLFTFGEDGSLDGTSNLAIDWEGAIELLGDGWDLGNQSWNPTLQNDITGVYITGVVAVPEPGTLALLSMAPFTLLAYAWRTRRRR